MVVNHIITGGSAERSGLVKLGDVIVSVDSQDVRGKVCLLPPTCAREKVVARAGGNIP